MPSVLAGRMNWFYVLFQELSRSSQIRDTAFGWCQNRPPPRLFDVVPAEGSKSRERDNGNSMNYRALAKVSRVQLTFFMR